MSLFDDKDALARIQAATDYPLERAADGRVVGQFFDSRLASVFQPVFSIEGRHVAGHAAQVRSSPVAREQAATTPLGIFALATEDPLLVRLDRLCRTVHALNYFDRAAADQVLYLGVQARLLESVKDGHGRAYERVLDLIGVETSRVAIELPSEVNRDPKLFRHVTANYRSRGYRIACTHVGPEDGWFGDLGSLYPDVLRIDARALRQPHARHLADEVHRFGAALLVQNIDSAEDLAAAVRANADIVQGDHLARPDRDIEPASERILQSQPTGCAR